MKPEGNLIGPSNSRLESLRLKFLPYTRIVDLKSFEKYTKTIRVSPTLGDEISFGKFEVTILRLTPSLVDPTRGPKNVKTVRGSTTVTMTRHLE